MPPAARQGAPAGQPVAAMPPRRARRSARPPPRRSRRPPIGLRRVRPARQRHPEQARPSWPAPRRRPGQGRPPGRAASSRRTRTRVKAGSQFCGSSQGCRPSAATGAAGLRAAEAAGAAADTARDRRHPGQRPGARAAGESEQDSLGLIVQRVPEHDRRARPSAACAAASARRTWPTGRRLPALVARPGPARPGYRHRARQRWAQAKAGQQPGDSAACSAEPGWRPWSTVTAACPQSCLRRLERQRRGSASESAPPEHATSTRSPGHLARSSAGPDGGAGRPPRPGAGPPAAVDWARSQSGRSDGRRCRRLRAPARSADWSARPWSAASPVRSRPC